MRIRLWIHIIFALFAGFLTLPNCLAMMTEAALTKSARLADSSSATTTTTKESVLRSGGKIGLSAVCLGPVKVCYAPLPGILRHNCGRFAEAARCLAAKGGIGPVLKGQEGVARAIAEYEAAGGKILGEQISMRAGGGRTIPYLYGQNAQGIREFIEVKNGSRAALNPNQSRLFPIIEQSGGVPVGGNAAAAGFTPGVPVPPTPVRIIHYP